MKGRHSFTHEYDYINISCISGFPLPEERRIEMELIYILAVFGAYVLLTVFLLEVCLDERCPMPSEMKVSRRAVLYALFALHVVLALAILSF